MLETGVGGESKADAWVEFLETGAKARGEFHCVECGYGVIVQTRLPTCPMCAGRVWEQSTWSRLGRL